MARRTKLSQARAPRRVLGLELAVESLKQFRNSIGGQNFEEMVNALSKIFRAVGQEFLWAQLILFDENDTVTFALMNPEEPDSPSGISIRELSTRLIGFDFEPGSVIRRLYRDFPDTSICFREARAADSNKAHTAENQGRFLRYYDLYSINLQAKSASEILAQRLEENQPLPTFINTVKHPTMSPWLRNMVVTGSSWPALGDLPRMSGIVIFPIKSGRGFERRGEGLKRSLFGRRKDIPFFSWLILYVAFVFQTYALSQATVDEPQRLRDYVARNGWLRMLREAGNGRDIDKIRDLIRDVLSIGRTVASRSVLREFFEVLGEFPAKFTSEVSQSYVDEFLSPDLITANEVLLQCGLLHLKALYAGRDSGSLHAFQKELVWPRLQVILGSALDAVKPYAYSALCDLIITSSQDLLALIGEFLVDEGRAAMQRNSFDAELLNALFLEIMVVADDGLISQLVELLGETYARTIAQDTSPFFHEIMNRAYASLRVELQTELLQELEEKRGTPAYALKSLAEIHRIQSGLRSMEDFPSLFSPTDELPGMKILTVVSHKGGVGKSLLSAAIASLLSRTHKVALLDLDLFGPTLFHVVSEKDRLTRRVFLNQLITEISDLKIDPPLDKARELVRDYGWTGSDVNLTIFPCSPFREDQDQLYPLIMSKSGLQSLMYSLYRFSRLLHQQRYEFVIFDTPNEMKDIALAAASLSRAYGGSILYVSTLYDPALQPFFDSMPIEYCQASNILLVNKLRYFDKQYARNKAALFDMIGSRYRIVSADSPTSFTSEALLERIFNLEYCFPVSWNEQLERFLSSGQESYQDHLSPAKLALLMEADLNPLIAELTRNPTSNTAD